MGQLVSRAPHKKKDKKQEVKLNQNSKTQAELDDLLEEALDESSITENFDQTSSFDSFSSSDDYNYFHDVANHLVDQLFDDSSTDYFEKSNDYSVMPYSKNASRFFVQNNRQKNPNQDFQHEYSTKIFY